MAANSQGYPYETRLNILFQPLQLIDEKGAGRCLSLQVV